jgi:AcrR family transcriptional regulator
MEDMSIAEIAEATGLTESTVNVHFVPSRVCSS